MFAPLWRIAYENRYTTRSWVVHRFDGFGLLIKLLITTFDFGSFSSLSFFSNIKQANTFWAVSAVASYAPICTIISTRSWSNKSPRFYFKLFFFSTFDNWLSSFFLFFSFSFLFFFFFFLITCFCFKIWCFLTFHSCYKNFFPSCYWDWEFDYKFL